MRPRAFSWKRLDSCARKEEGSYSAGSSINSALEVRAFTARWNCEQTAYNCPAALQRSASISRVRWRCSSSFCTRRSMRSASFFNRSVCNRRVLQVPSDPDDSGAYHFQNIPICQVYAGGRLAVILRYQEQRVPAALQAPDQAAAARIDGVVAIRAEIMIGAAIRRQRREQSNVAGVKQ